MPSNDPVRCAVTVTAGRQQHDCIARVDFDCWSARFVPLELTGVLEVSRAEWKDLGAKEHLILILKETGEPYRMILDAGTGRFLARRL